MGEDLERRTIEDRRKQPTPSRSFYTFFGRRRWLRRKSDQEKGRYLDRYSPALFFFIVLILALNILDSFFTMMIMDLGGVELNPIISVIMKFHGYKFWIWKFVIVSICLVLLCFHRGFKLVRKIVILISSMYLLIVLYQILIVSHFVTPVW
jgi:hypothetical protein